MSPSHPPDVPDVPEADDRDDPLIGAHLGDYRVVGLLGTGGMGVVYRGVQPVIGKEVAIKVLQADLARTGDAGRLLTEARLVNEIRHRGIVDIFSFGQLEDGRQYLVMELLEGQPLDVVIAQKAPFDPLALVAVLDEMLDALAAAHDAGVIHRDLKPNNVFLVVPQHGVPYVKLLDFGLAKQALAPGRVTPQTRADLVVGTPHYMAPEQARGLPVSPATDLYAVGCVAYEMATGALPFNAPSAYEVVAMHVNAEVPRILGLNASVSPKLDELVARMMHKDPAARPPSAMVVRAELKLIKETLRGEQTVLYRGTADAGAPLDPSASALELLVSAPTVRRAQPRSAARDSVGSGPTVRRPSRPSELPRRPTGDVPKPSSVPGSATLSSAPRGASAAAAMAPSPPRAHSVRRALVVASAAVLVAGAGALFWWGGALWRSPPADAGAGSERGATVQGGAQPGALEARALAASQEQPGAHEARGPAKPQEQPGAAADRRPTQPARQAPTENHRAGTPSTAEPSARKASAAKASQDGEALTKRIDRHLVSLRGQQSRGENVGTALTLLRAIQADAAAASSAEERSAVAADLAEWEQRYGGKP